MGAPKGRAGGNAGKGRPRGSPNKITADLKAMILGALSDVGGQAYLAEQAQRNPTAFLTLLGKVLPLTLHGNCDNPLATSVSFEEERREAIAAIHAAFAEPRPD